MRQTNVCLNRVFKVHVNLRKMCIPGAHASFCACEKCAMKINKDKKTTGASYKVTREMRVR